MSKNKKRIAWLLALNMMIPTVAFAAPKSDYEEHWAKASIESAISKGYIAGYGNNVFKPNQDVTRAEFVSIVNGAFGFQEVGETSFKDVSDSDWYAKAIKIGVKQGYISGTSNTHFSPKQTLTREQAAVILSKVSKLSPNEAALESFKDKAQVSSWARGAVGACVEAGIIKGNTDGSFAPKKGLTRAEAVSMIERLLAEKTTEKEETNKDVSVDKPGTVIENKTIGGNLTIEEGVGEGEATLKNVTVKGDVIVKGGGLNSIYLVDATVEGTIIVAKRDGKVKIVATGNTVAKVVQLQSGAILVEQKLTGEGFKRVTIDENYIKGQKIEIIGRIDEVINQADSEVEVIKENKAIKIAKGETKNVETPSSSGGGGGASSGGSSGGSSSGGSSSGGSSGGGSSTQEEDAEVLRLGELHFSEITTPAALVTTSSVVVVMKEDLFIKAKEGKAALKLRGLSDEQKKEDFLKENTLLTEEQRKQISEGRYLDAFLKVEGLKDVVYDYSDFMSKGEIKILIHETVEEDKNYSIIFDAGEFLQAKENKKVKRQVLEFDRRPKAPTPTPEANEPHLRRKDGTVVQKLTLLVDDRVELTSYVGDKVARDLEIKVEGDCCAWTHRGGKGVIQALKEGEGSLLLIGEVKVKIPVSVVSKEALAGTPKFLEGYPKITIGKENNRYYEEKQLEIRIKTDIPAQIYIVEGWDDEYSIREEVLRGYRPGGISGSKYYGETNPGEELVIPTHTSLRYASSSDVFSIVATAKGDKSKATEVQRIAFENTEKHYIDENAPWLRGVFLNQSKDRIVLTFDEALDEKSVPKSEEFEIAGSSVKEVKILNKWRERKNGEKRSVSTAVVLELNSPLSTHTEVVYKGTSLQDMSDNHNKAKEFRKRTEDAKPRVLIEGRNESGRGVISFDKPVNLFWNEPDLNGWKFDHFYHNQGIYTFDNENAGERFRYSAQKQGKVDLNEVMTVTELYDAALDYVENIDIPLTTVTGSAKVVAQAKSYGGLKLKFDRVLYDDDVLGDSFQLSLDGEKVDSFFIDTDTIRWSRNDKERAKEIRFRLISDYFKYHEKTIENSASIELSYKANSELDIGSIKDFVGNIVEAFSVTIP